MPKFSFKNFPIYFFPFLLHNFFNKAQSFLLILMYVGNIFFLMRHNSTSTYFLWNTKKKNGKMLTKVVTLKFLFSSQVQNRIDQMIHISSITRSITSFWMDISFIQNPRHYHLFKENSRMHQSFDKIKKLFNIAWFNFHWLRLTCSRSFKQG